MEKLLFFVDCFEMGGIQIFLRNVLMNIDKSKFQCEFLVIDDGNTYSLEAEIEQIGGRIHKLKDCWIDKPADYIRYCKNVNAFFKNNHDYKAIHVNASSKNSLILYYAKKYKIKKRIIHSHNTGFQTTSSIKIMVGNLLKAPLKMWSTDFLACSEIAGEWLFGKKAVASGRVKVIPNGIDTNRYKFCSETRDRLKNELGIQDSGFVVGHIGRFVKQKNHSFLIDIFEEIVKLRPDSCLVLAGTGELMDECESKVREKGLEHCVHFLGFRNDVPDLLQAYDVFLMPSYHEGFPVTAIEAQASGCPCVLSETITAEAAIIEKTQYVSLDAPASLWAQTTVETYMSDNDRSMTQKILVDKGFDIHGVVKELETIYLS